MTSPPERLRSISIKETLQNVNAINPVFVFHHIN